MTPSYNWAVVSFFHYILYSILLVRYEVGWLGCVQGGQKVQEAFFIYQELAEKYNWSVRGHPRQQPFLSGPETRMSASVPPPSGVSLDPGIHQNRVFRAVAFALWWVHLGTVFLYRDRRLGESFRTDQLVSVSDLRCGLRLEDRQTMKVQGGPTCRWRT
jgi:hypothetical protein